MTDAQAQIVDPMIGAHIDGRYLVQGILGRGGMAVVYEGVHEQLGRSVAIKVLSSGIALDPVLVERFLREARMASGLSHSNIVEVWDLGRLPDGRPYLVMPKLAGVDFASFLERNGPQSPARVVELLSGVALALDFVHAKGLLHRDVKLENLMHIEREDGSEHVMLMDFGIATAAAANPASARLTDYGVVCGTPAYLPPEVAVGAISDRRGDVYALATVAFELMTGRLPFETDDPLRILPLKATRDAPRMSEVTGHPFPEAIEQVIAQGLAFRPEERFSRAGEFVAALEDAVVQSAEELGIAGRPGDRRSLQFFGRGSLHSALYKIPEREHPRSLAPAERMSEGAAARRRASTPRARNPVGRPPPRRGALGTLGWMGCFALAAVLAPLIWNAGRSGVSRGPTAKPPAAVREPEQEVWEVRPPTPEMAAGSARFESSAPAGEAPSEEPPSEEPTQDSSATSPVAVTSDRNVGSGNVPQVATGRAAGDAPALERREAPAPPQVAAKRAGTPPSGASNVRTPPTPTLEATPPAPTPEPPPEPTLPSEPVAAAPEIAAPPAQGASPAEPPPAPVERATTPAAAVTGTATATATTATATPGARNDAPGQRPLVEPLPVPLDRGPRAQLSRVPAPPPLERLNDRATATDALPREGVPVAKLNEEASAALLGGHLARAAGLYQQATRTDPQNVSAWRGLALTSERLGRSREAIAAYTRALELAPLGAQAETLRNRLKSLQSHP